MTIAPERGPDTGFEIFDEAYQGADNSIGLFQQRPDSGYWRDSQADIWDRSFDACPEQVKQVAGRKCVKEQIFADLNEVTYTTDGTVYPGGTSVSQTHTVDAPTAFMYSYQPLTSDDLYAAVRNVQADETITKAARFYVDLCECTPSRGQLLGRHDGHEYYWDLPLRNPYRKQLDAIWDSRLLEERCAEAAADMSRATAFIQPPHLAYPSAW